MGELKYEICNLIGELLTSGAVRDVEVAKKIEIQHIEEEGPPMSRAELFQLPGISLGFSEASYISDILEDTLLERQDEWVCCTVCSEEKYGSIEECGIFLLKHEAFHKHADKIASMMEADEE